MTCSSGPPCWPGNTAELIFLAISASLVRMTPPRGPPRVLWVVEVTTWACGTGDGCSPAATKTGEMRHVHHQVGADLVGDLAEPGEVELARVGRPSGDDQLRLVLPGGFGDAVHVDEVVLLGHPVGGDVVQLAGEVQPHAVRQVAAAVQRQTEDGVARLDQGVHHSGVGLRARMRLYVGEFRSEQRLDPVDGQPFDHVDVLAAAVVAPARVALRRTCWSAPNPAPA